MEKYNYYRDQLEQINANDLGTASQFKINKNGKQTHWISLNNESATELYLWLENHFEIKK